MALSNDRKNRVVVLGLAIRPMTFKFVAKYFIKELIDLAEPETERRGGE